jgi:7-keto-8-aminopelargonate synthetase-like enzyme
MDGDIVPLPDMLSIAEKYDAMIYIDDAHGTGVLGHNGKGTTEYFNINSPRIICMGTLSKAYGALGGFIATEGYITDLLRLSCSAYGFTSTLPPDQVYAVSMAMDIVHSEPQRRERLWNNQKYFISKVELLGLNVISRQTCIVPILIGNEEHCESIAHALAEEGFHVDSIIFPAVKRGQARLRFNMNSHHTHDQIDHLVAVLAEQQRAGHIDGPQSLAVAC